MSTELIEKINLKKIAEKLERHENKWVAVSSANEAVGSGDTYNEAFKSTGGRDDIVLFKMPPLDTSLTP